MAFFFLNPFRLRFNPFVSVYRLIKDGSCYSIDQDRSKFRVLFQFRSKFRSTKTEAVRRLKTEAEAVLDQPTIDFQGLLNF
ncbi:hypothetical protein LXL04_006618 [Taraxacum kok-saghyz]